MLYPWCPLVTFAAFALGGCATFPSDLVSSCASYAPAIEYDQPHGTASTNITVLTYNVEGLPWPARRDRSRQLREIGRQLSAMRAEGRAPDVVLLQEVFSADAAAIAVHAGYPTRIQGPRRGVRRPPTSEGAPQSLVQRRKLNKGEGLGPALSSGLYVLSDFAVLRANAQPFRRRECAGFDCLANKGIQHVRLQVPGVPQPLDIFNTHLNARRASKVSDARSLEAHRLQINEVSRFIEHKRDQRYPMIFGGDFNMRNAEGRFEHFSLRTPHPLVHQYCLKEAGACEVTLSWDGDTPWMDTQDLQGFENGEVVHVRPIRVEAMFDTPWNGRPLADHDGLLVTYRLSWTASAQLRSFTGSICKPQTLDRSGL